LLLAGGLDPATTFANNVTALHAAVSNKEGSVEVVKLLLEKNSSKEFIETRQTDSGRTALHVAAEENCRALLL
jgi:ankyrin repeat protein